MLRVRTHLILMAAAILVPVVIFSALALHMLRSSVRQEALRGLSETASATALGIDREMASSVASLELLSASPALENADMPAFYEQARLLNNDHMSWIMLIDVLGEQVLHTLIPLGQQVPQAALFDDMWKAVESKRAVSSSLTRNPLDGGLMTVIYMPMKTRAGKTFVVAKGFKLEFFSKTLLERNTPTDWVIGLLDHDGRIIARNFNNDIRVGQPARPELLDAIRATGRGIIRHPTTEGVDSYDAFTQSQVTGWPISVAAPVETVETAAARAAAVAALGFLVAIGVAVLAAAVLGRQLVKSIADAAEAASSLGTGQPPRAHVSSKVVELHRLQVALADASSMLQREQLSRQQAESKLEELLQSEYKARLRAEAENQAKDQFLAMLGHELRNPLAAIGGAIALDQQQAAGKPAGSPIDNQARDIIQRQSEHLGHIVNDLLDISRLAGGKISLSTRPLDFSKLAEGCVDALRATGRTAGFSLKVSTRPVWVDGDATRLEQSVSNLLVNALKFTPPGGKIELRVGEEDGQAALHLRDSGVGISTELLPHVFDVFTQGPASLDRSQGGLGIGLALVRQLVRLHGGTVEAASAGPGLGSTFTIRLPRIQAPEQAVQAQAPSALPNPEAAPQVVPPAPAAATHLLLIEDIDDVRRMMSQLLELEGYRVSDTAQAREGVRMATELQPTVGIIDIGLPDMNGYDVARALRSNPATRHMGLMALTGYGQEEDRRKALEAGFDVHLVKPVDIDALFESIEVCAQLARRRRQDLEPFSHDASRTVVTT